MSARAQARAGGGVSLSSLQLRPVSGPRADQLHGFEERLTTDLDSADFACTPDWRSGNPPQPWSNSVMSVLDAGPLDLTQRHDYDEETVHRVVRKLHDIGRARQHRAPGSEALQRPFLTMVSLAHPSNPYITTRPYWDRYSQNEIDMPRVTMAAHQLHDGRGRARRRSGVERAADPCGRWRLNRCLCERSSGHSLRLREMGRFNQVEVTPVHVRNSRHAYYGQIRFARARRFGRCRSAPPC